MFTNSFIVSINIAVPKKLPKTNVNKFISLTRNKVENIINIPRIVVDKKSVLYLVGTELDFTDGLNGKGFSFNNPNASRTCGCGESFSI